MFLALLTVLIASAAADSTAHRHLLCRSVQGRMSATATRLSPSLQGLRITGQGTSEGDFVGGVQLDVLKPFFTSDLKVAFRVLAADGEITARGRTAVTQDPATPSLRRVEGSLSFEGATGVFDNASGHVAATGTADTHARTLSIRYEGQICRPVL